MADVLSTAWAPQDGQPLDLGLEAIGRVAGGDTGLRQIKGLLDPSWTATNVFIRRVGSLVYMEFEGLSSVSGPEGEWVFAFSASSGAIPGGFRPPTANVELSFVARPNNVAVMRRAAVSSGGGLTLERAANWGSGRFQLSWFVLTNNFPAESAWPGTAV